MLKKLHLLVLLFLVNTSCVNDAENKSIPAEIKPYIDFLEEDHPSAKDYILGLFENHDIVVLCERYHPEMTQYDLILDVCGDKQFIDQVGNIFIEVCSKSQSTNIDQLLQLGISDSLYAKDLIREIQRNSSHYPISSRTNFPFFLNGLLNINQRNSDSKVRLFPTDVYIDWKTQDSLTYPTFWNEHIPIRDEVMAKNIISVFDSLEDVSGRQKALVIMNYRHAFNQHTIFEDDTITNTAAYLFENYPHRVANVMLNSFTDSREGETVPIQDGKWDAAVLAEGIEDIGFDFKESPFGRDDFDYWSYDERYTYDSIFTGYVHYKHSYDFKMLHGVKGLVDSLFAQEVKRRSKISYRVQGGQKPLTETAIWRANTVEEWVEYKNDSLVDGLINQWLEE